MNERGWSPPFMWMLIIGIGLLTWWLGWLVIPGVVVLFGLITLGVWIHDLVVHDAQCRWCNVIKEEVAAERDISEDRIRTKHRDTYPTYMQVQVYIDSAPDVRVDIDFNGVIHRVQAPPYPDREPLDI